VQDQNPSAMRTAFPNSQLPCTPQVRVILAYVRFYAAYPRLRFPIHDSGSESRLALTASW
jgi:hypothetical protein